MEFESFKEILIAIFGEYIPVANQTGLGSWDIPWICGFILFAIGFYCIFRFIGGLFNGKYIW